MARSAILFLCVAMFFGCASSEPDAVPGVGDPAELARLAGEWSGHYDSAATGRGGSIVFHLPVDGPGHGDVVMVPLPRMIQKDTRARRGRADIVSSPTVIDIREVRVAAGIITGELEPYFAPDDGLMAGTSFRGALDGDQIVGTLTMHSGTRVAPMSGTSTVRRKRGN
jgi:hypothetical protein